MTKNPSPDLPGPALAVEDIHKDFAGVHALRGITLDFPRGTVTALMGENGAGKSTLIKIINGDHRPGRGRVLVAGTPAYCTAPPTPAGTASASSPRNPRSSRT